MRQFTTVFTLIAIIYFLVWLFFGGVNFVLAKLFPEEPEIKPTPAQIAYPTLVPTTMPSYKPVKSKIYNNLPTPTVQAANTIKVEAPERVNVYISSLDRTVKCNPLSLQTVLNASEEYDTALNCERQSADKTSSCRAGCGASFDCLDSCEFNQELDSHMCSAEKIIAKNTLDQTLKASCI